MLMAFGTTDRYGTVRGNLPFATIQMWQVFGSKDRFRTSASTGRFLEA